MANSSLGTKFLCFQCATKFYDLNRPEAVCPKCSADQSLAPAKRQERGRARAAHRDLDDEDLDSSLDDEDAPVLEDGFSSDDDELEAEEY